LPVVKVGRIAGQFVKPRSAPTEEVDGVELPSFLGHMVNSELPSNDARRPDPERMVRGYYQAAATLNLVRAFTKGGFADLSGVHNPIGVKIGPEASADDILRLCERLNPARVPGRLTLIARLGSAHVRELLPPLLEAMREAEHPVVWACDPMHANTTRTASGLK